MTTRPPAQRRSPPPKSRKSRLPKATAPAGARLPDAHDIETLLQIVPGWYYWEQDEEYRFTRLTGTVFEEAGIDRDTYLGKTRWELGTVPVGDDGNWDAHKAVLDARQPFADYLFKYVGRRGEVRYVSASGQPRFDRRGRFKGYRGLASDVTQRIRAERRLTLEHGIARILAEAGGIAEAVPRIIRLFCESLRWACGAYWEMEGQRQELRCLHTWGVSSPDIDEFLASAREATGPHERRGGVIRRACDRGEAVWIADVSRDDSFMRAAHAAQAALKGAFAFPVKAGLRIIGALEFFGREADPPDRELIAAAVYIGSSIGEFRRRKAAEEELRRLSTAVDASPDLIYVIDPATMRFIYVNDTVGSSRVDLQACKLEYSIVSPK